MDWLNSPFTLAIVATGGMLTASYLTYRGSQKYTKKKVENLPQSLVKEFAKLNPGVDTVEKVIELLYAEISRQNTKITQLEGRIEELVNEKQGLLNEISALKSDLDAYKIKLEYMEARITESIKK